MALAVGPGVLVSAGVLAWNAKVAAGQEALIHEWRNTVLPDPYECTLAVRSLHVLAGWPWQPTAAGCVY